MGLFDFGKKQPQQPQQPNYQQPAQSQQQGGVTPAQYVAAGHNMRNQKRWSEAMEYYKVAANAGDPEGLYWLGCCVLTGYGAQKNELLACQLYSLASRKGHQEATKTLFNFLDATIKECNQKADDAGMVPYLKVGAEAGHIQSICLYGFFQTVGAGNMPVNKQEGYRWLKLASDNNYALAKELLAKYF